MKSVLLLAIWLPVFNFFNSQNDRAIVLGSQQKVYICTGNQAKRYHKKFDCWGLQQCKSGIDSMSVAKAITIKRTACRIKGCTE